MQNWDRLVMILLNAGVAIYTGYGGWRLWRRQQRGAAVGVLALVVCMMALPLALLALRDP